MKKLYTLALILAASCGETTTTPPSQLNLDQPTNITFACVGGLRIIPDDRADQNVGDPADEIIFSASPTTNCDVRSLPQLDLIPDPNNAPDTPQVPPNQANLTASGGLPVGNSDWFGFILQQGPGTVAIAQFDTRPSTDFPNAGVTVLDADPLTPGKNSISVGEDPVAIATDKAGCKVVTANAGSCDISVLDITSAVDFNPSTPIDVRRIEVTTPNGTPIRAKPTAMVAEPASDVIGKRCPDTASGLMYVAYPSCHLVAAIDVSTGTLAGGINYASGAPVVLGTADLDGIAAQCVDECEGGAAPTPGIRPVSIDLERDARKQTRRMVIGSDNSNLIHVFDIDPVTSLPITATPPVEIAFENTTGDLGITEVTLSPQIGMGGDLGTIFDDNSPGGESQFVYAIATDDTIRVADVLDLKKECDTQVDSRFLRTFNSVRDLSCLPVGDVATPPRRVGARGPGIQLVGDVIPMSVDIIKSEPGATPDATDPARMVGYFAIIAASNGGVFVANVDDDSARDTFSPAAPLETPMAISVPHSLRDAIPNRGALGTIEVDDDGDSETPPVVFQDCELNNPVNVKGQVVGAPHTTAEPARNIPIGTFATAKAFQLPGFRQLRCDGVDASLAITDLQFAADAATRDFVYPDLGGLFAQESWSLIWEGTLSLDQINTSVDGPVVRESEMRIDGSGLHMIDAAKPYCDAGVERFDFVQMRGCDPQFGNGDCPTGFRCFVHPESQLQGVGACLLDDEADRLADTCRDFLTSLRRFTVGATKSGDLQLLPRRHTLRTTPIEGCTSNEQCTELADYALTQAVSQHPMFDTTEPDTHTWTCEADPLLAAVPTGKRCQMRCDANVDCVTGTVCQGGKADGTKAGFCMEGVLPPQACINAPQRYEIRAGEAFSVIGSRSGFQHPTIADANGTCVKNPAANPYQIGRIPLTPPACDPTADPISGQLADGTFEPNPCSLTVETTDVVPQYEDGTCDLKATPTELIPRQAQAIRFRNKGLNLTIVDPTYPGDAACILDRKGTLGNIPHVFTGYQMSFTQTAGFAQLDLPTVAALPVRIVRGPTNSIWVVDQGDFLSTSLSQPSTRGKVFRIDVSTPGNPITIQ